ncbi:MAG: dependent protein [Thermosediminibacterales bacterium]|nr:dependent protein [Thermosediminibacterales bacterium]MDK2836084.1 dependent protein [Thermosediminibacterales bacterium]
MSYIRNNLKDVKNIIKKAALKSNRNPEEIALVAVTKTVGPNEINEAIKAGVKIIGENRVQEMLQKIDKVDKNVSWHMIGHLQTNKVKYALKHFDLIHSLDRYSLAKEINKRAQKEGKIQDTLLQLNITGEKTKYGLKPDEVEDFINGIGQFSFLRLKGLMTIMPYVANTEELRPYFREMKRIFDHLQKANLPKNVEMKYLSMGMTNDFEIAVEEGSNMVRIGTGIFGERNY